MIAPEMKCGITGFDTRIWTLKRYKLGKLLDYKNYVENNLTDWEKALEFINYNIRENNIFKEKLNPFLPETIIVTYRKKKKYDKKFGITQDDFYNLERILIFYSYHIISEENLGGYKRITFQLYTKEEIKEINSKTYQRFFEIKREDEEKKQQDLEWQKKCDEHKDWIDWQMDLWYKD